MKLDYFFYLKTFILLLLIQSTSFSQHNSTQLKYLAQNSDAIITGKVVQMKSQWNEKKTRIFTTATIEVEEYLKGMSQANRIEVNFPGGEIDGIGELYTHTAKLDDQEDVLLFVKKETGTEQYNILDGDQGKLSLRLDKRTGEKLTSDNKKLSVYKTEIRKIITRD